MTKQEEIKEEIKKYLRPLIKYENEDILDGIVWYIWNELLHSQGVVIKDSRDPADCESCPVAVVCGYVAVAPLIEER